MGSVLVGLASIAASGCTQTSEQPQLAGQDVHLAVIHTSDIHSRIFPYTFAPGQIDKGLGLIPSSGNNASVGGIARMATVAQRDRYSASRVLHVDSGDIFQGAPVFNVFAGEAEVRAMTQLGLSAMVIGNHEFDRGAANLVQQVTRYGGFPMLAANYSFSDPADPAQPKLGRISAPFVIYNVQGLRVALVGMANFSSLQGIYEGGNSLGVRPLDPLQVIQDTVRLLREHVDVIALVSHMGLEEDEGLAQANEVVDENETAAIQGVDVIFGGHLHIVLNPPKRIDHPDGTFTILCHSGAFAKYMGRLDMVVHVGDKRARCMGEEQGAPCQGDAECGGGAGSCKVPETLYAKSHVKSFTYKLTPIDSRIPEDPDMAHMLEPYRVEMNLLLRLDERFAVVPCPDTAATCPKVLRSDPNGGDSQLGNLVATAMRLRRRVEADFSLTNTLGIRSDFESGALDYEQMYNVFPFENTITTMNLSGREIEEMLDFLAARASERGCRSQAQVAGLWFVADCTHRVSCGPYDVTGKLATECHPEDRLLAYDSPDRKDGPPLLGADCRDNPAGCSVIQPFGSYRVAVNDYIANGGSGFVVLKRNTTKFDTGISLRDALIDFLRTLPNRCDASGYSNLMGTDPITGLPYDLTPLPCIVPEGVESHNDRIKMVSP